MKNLLLLLCSALLWACTPNADENRAAELPADEVAREEVREENPYDINEVYGADVRDTLLTDMITYICRKPSRATVKTRENAEFRAYYVGHIEEFEWVNYHITADSTHYYYLIRPARSTQGNLRGVGGKFRLGSDMKLQDFEETYNTVIMSRTELISVGNDLFEHHIENDNVDDFIQNSDYIEWPDDRLKYSKKTNEWRYDL